MNIFTDALNGLANIIIEILSPIGITEPVFQFMLVSALLGLSIYLTLYTGMFSLANAGFMAIGAYVSVVMTQFVGLELGWALLIAMFVCGLIALPIGLPVLRLNDIYLAIATIGFGEVVRIIVLNFDNIAEGIITRIIETDFMGWSAWLLTQAETSEILSVRELSSGIRVTFELIGGARGLKNIPKITESWMLIVFLVLVVYFIIRLHRSRFGRSMAAIRQDEKAAANMSINVVYVKNVVFIMSAVIAGAAGAFNGHLTRIVVPSAFGFERTVDILAFAVLGGTSTWLGPIVGGMVLAAIPEVLRFLNQYRGVFNGLVLLVMIVYVPGGLVNPAGLRAFFRQQRERRQLESEEQEAIT